MYKTMTFKERVKYLKGKVFFDLFFSLLFGLIISIVIYSILVDKKILPDDGILSNIGIGMFLGIALIIFIIRLIFPYNVLSRKLQITNGYILNRKSDRERRLWANARTYDGSKTTGYHGIPYDFIHGQIPVKVLIYKNKARGFFITDESYAYVEEHSSSSEKKQKKIAKILAIIFIIYFIINVILFFFLQ